PREVDVEQDVGVVDDERPLREHRLRVLERAAGPEDRILGKEDDPLPPVRGLRPRARGVGRPVQVDPDLAVATAREPGQDALDDRRAEDWQEGLGQVAGGRSEPLAEPRRGEEDIERIRGHLYELIARHRPEHHETGPSPAPGREGVSGNPPWRPWLDALLHVLAEEPEAAFP